MPDGMLSPSIPRSFHQDRQETPVFCVSLCPTMVPLLPPCIYECEDNHHGNEPHFHSDTPSRLQAPIYAAHSHPAGVFSGAQPCIRRALSRGHRCGLTGPLALGFRCGGRCGCGCGSAWATGSVATTSNPTTANVIATTLCHTLWFPCMIVLLYAHLAQQPFLIVDFRLAFPSLSRVSFQPWCP
jgi:hypothetical protein